MSRFYRAARLDDDTEKDLEVVEFRADAVESKIRTDKRLNISGLQRYGLCATCRYCFFSRSEFNVTFALCSFLEESGTLLRLNSRYPTTECNGFSERNYQPSLHDMYRMATIIDPPKRGAGFIKED